VKVLGLDGFDHRVSWPAKVRNVSRLGSQISGKSLRRQDDYLVESRFRHECLRECAYFAIYTTERNYRRDLLEPRYKATAAWAWTWAEPELNNSSDNYGTKRFLKEPSRKLKTTGATAVVATPSKNPFPPSPDFQLLIFRSRADEWDEWPRLAVDANEFARDAGRIWMLICRKRCKRALAFFRGRKVSHGGDSDHLDLRPTDTHALGDSVLSWYRNFLKFTLRSALKARRSQ
jgi:hypothetical protein